MRHTQIFSIFGQIEQVVAEAMIEEGVANKIPQSMIPASVKYNDKNEIAKFAIVLDDKMVSVFNKRVADLRA